MGTSWRLARQLQMGSVVVKQESQHKEWYYPLLRPDVDYVSVDHELSDLVPKVRWWVGGFG